MNQQKSAARLEKPLRHVWDDLITEDTFGKVARVLRKGDQDKMTNDTATWLMGRTLCLRGDNQRASRLVELQVYELIDNPRGAGKKTSVEALQTQIIQSNSKVSARASDGQYSDICV